MSMFARLAAATLLATAASPVAALSIQFVLTGPHSASFLVPQNPAPAVTNVGSYFDLKVSRIFDNIAGLRTLWFYNNNLQGGFEVIGLFSTRYTQLYLGSEAAPTFYTGDYQLLDRADLCADRLSDCRRGARTRRLGVADHRLRIDRCGNAPAGNGSNGSRPRRVIAARVTPAGSA